jgi:hypothetical protein
MRSEDLNERDLKGRDFPVHEDSGQIQLNLEADINTRPIDCRRPPKGEAPIRNLNEATALSIGQLFILHLLLETASFLPEKPLPGREICTLKERMLQDSLDSTERL